jgi:hypothetical protein
VFSESHCCICGRWFYSFLTVTRTLPPTSFVTLTFTTISVSQAATRRMGDVHLRVAA